MSFPVRHTLALLLCCLALVAAAAEEDASNHRPVTTVADQRLSVQTAAGQGLLALYADPAQPAADTDRVVIVIHGRLRDADVYFKSAQAARAAAGDVGRHTQLLVPQFLADRDASAYKLAPEVLRWSLTGWMGGEPAHAPAAIASYEALDALLASLADKQRYPKLKQVVIAGHSGGAQVVQRYAVVGQGEAVLAKQGIKLRYVVANPSSYLYFSADRPDGQGGYKPFNVAGCGDFNLWKYGWEDAPAYARQLSPADYEQRYAARDVVYLLGTADTNPNHPALDKTCAAEAQGPYRYARGQAYARYVAQRNPASRQPLYPVPGVGHDGDRMLTSTCGLAALFDAGRCQAQ
ncbi:alpha/beta fold hydrolase [Chitinimonas sp.]|uniref:alpha/beta fold hydrolase n=1 Tax=Chitinimonas sp. TaxID=1934313 RepID=UPI002F95F3B6